MKTPEELAEEWTDSWHKECDYPKEILKHTKAATKTVFLAGYQAAQPQWINFKDKLPEIGQQIIICYDVGEGIKVQQGSRWPEDSKNKNGRYPWYFSQGLIFGHEHSLYWQPLPEPPKEEKQ